MRTPLPTKMLVKLRYHDDFSLDPGSGFVDSYAFRANGMYDPNLTGVGHQPRGFDQLMAMYDHFVVIKSHITAECINGDSAVFAGNVLGITVQDSSSSFATATDFMEYQYKKYSRQSLGAGSGRCITKMSVTPHKFLGRSKPLSDPDLKGSTSADPVEGVYFIVNYFNESTGVNPAAVRISANLIYYAVLIEPKQVSIS